MRCNACQHRPVPGGSKVSQASVKARSIPRLLSEKNSYAAAPYRPEASQPVSPHPHSLTRLQWSATGVCRRAGGDRPVPVKYLHRFIRRQCLSFAFSPNARRTGSASKTFHPAARTAANCCGRGPRSRSICQTLMGQQRPRSGRAQEIGLGFKVASTGRDSDREDRIAAHRARRTLPKMNTTIAHSRV